MKMHVVKYLDEILVITSGSNLSKKKKIKVEDVDHGLQELGFEIFRR